MGWVSERYVFTAYQRAAVRSSAQIKIRACRFPDEAFFPPALETCQRPAHESERAFQRRDVSRQKLHRLIPDREDHLPRGYFEASVGLARGSSFARLMFHHFRSFEHSQSTLAGLRQELMGQSIRIHLRGILREQRGPFERKHRAYFALIQILDCDPGLLPGRAFFPQQFGVAFPAGQIDTFFLRKPQESFNSRTIVSIFPMLSRQIR